MRNPVCIQENPARGVRNLPPQTKNPTYGPDTTIILSLRRPNHISFLMFGFVNRLDKVNWPPLTIHSDEGLTFKTSALESLYCGQFTLNNC